MKIWMPVALVAALLLGVAIGAYFEQIEAEADRIEARLQGRAPSSRYL
jgi:hypothetical protein